MHHFHKDFSQHFMMRSFLHRMETRRLHNSDMKRLVCIFRNFPVSTGEHHELYRKHTKKTIRRLPSRLRTSRLSFGPTNLCSIHKGLNQNLLNDIWGFIRHEFDGALGKFLYPLVMTHGLLTADQKIKVRQLEPVLQMWQPNFNLKASAPPGHEPVQCGTKWHYQSNQCPACMMSRLGSDEDVLFALFAGMVGRFNSKTVTTMDAIRSVAGWDSTKSKRLRLVRYWLKKISGETGLFRAGDFGMDLKRLRAQWKHEQGRHLRALARTRTDKMPVRPMPHQNVRPSIVAGAGHQRPLGRATTTKTVGLRRPQGKDAPDLFDPKLGPNPRPPDAKRSSPAEALGFEMPSMREWAYTVSHEQQEIHQALREQADDSMSPPTVRFAQQNSPEERSASFRIRRRPVPQQQFTSSHKREDSFLNPPISHRSFATTAPTIASYTGGPSARANYIDPLDNPIYNYIETQEERVEKYRRLLASCPDSDPFATGYEEDDASVFPKPQRRSMYSAFGDVAFDGARFDVIDEDFAEDEIEDWQKYEPEENEDIARGKKVAGGMRLGKGIYGRDSDAGVRSDNVY